MTQEMRDAAAKQQAAYQVMQDTVKQMTAPGLTEARKQELNETFSKAEKDQEDAYQLMQRLQKVSELETRNAEKFFQQEDAAGRTADKRTAEEVQAESRTAYIKYLTHGLNSMTSEERALLQPVESRGTATQIAGTTTLGGFLVPTGFGDRIWQTMKAYGGMLDVATIIQTDSGNSLPYPTNDDTSAAAVLVAESGSSTVQDTTFGQRTLSAYMYRDLQRASFELIQDSAFDIENFIISNMGIRFGRAANTSLTVGTGSSQPNGVVTASTLGKTAASATAFTFAEVIDLIHSVDPEYRRNARFMFHDNVLAYIKKLSIGTGDARPLWQPSFREGAPATIDGYQYTINQDMDSTINTASKLILFGDFSKYLVRQVRPLSIMRNDQLYMANGHVAWFGFARWDGNLMDTAAVKHLLTA